MPPPLTTQERFAFGHHQRKHMRRADHAGWTPRHRTESPLKLLHASEHGRLPSLVAIKHQRMAASPFGFFRGAVPVMAYDLSLAPNTEILNQLCGDAHVRNLGAFSGPDGRLIFDINDFDETILGPFEWDVKRMATSLILAGREIGARETHCHEAAAVFLQSYRRHVLDFARMPVRELAKYQVRRLKTLSPMADIFLMAERATPLHTLLTLTDAPAQPHARQKQHAKSSKKKTSTPATEASAPPPPHPHRIFKTIEPLLTRLTGQPAQRVIDSLATYADSLAPERRHFLAQYQPIDVAFKVVGTGSVGLRDYCIYMQGIGPKDPLFIQIKEEAVSAYAPYLGENPSTPLHQGQRVVQGEHAMQVQSDPFLGWTTIENRPYLVRQLNDHKASINLAQLKSAALLEYAAVCGEILARGHARSGDPAVLAGYIGASERFDVAIRKFSAAYADQTDADWKHFVHAVKSHPKPHSATKSQPKSARASKPKPKTHRP